MINETMKAAFRAQMLLDGLTELVSVELRSEGENSLYIEAIWSEVDRGRGYAGRALGLLVCLADRYGVTLTLVPHWLAYDVELYPEGEQGRLYALNECKLNNEQLERWYSRHGFSRSGFMECDDPIMVREPIRNRGL